jgi:hypothetical protein
LAANGRFFRTRRQLCSGIAEGSIGGLCCTRGAEKKTLRPRTAAQFNATVLGVRGRRVAAEDRLHCRIHGPQVVGRGGRGLGSGRGRLMGHYSTSLAPKFIFEPVPVMQKWRERSLFVLDGDLDAGTTRPRWRGIGRVRGSNLAAVLRVLHNKTVVRADGADHFVANRNASTGHVYGWGIAPMSALSSRTKWGECSCAVWKQHASI